MKNIVKYCLSARKFIDIDDTRLRFVVRTSVVNHDGGFVLSIHMSANAPPLEGEVGRGLWEVGKGLWEGREGASDAGVFSTRSCACIISFSPRDATTTAGKITLIELKTSQKLNLQSTKSTKSLLILLNTRTRARYPSYGGKYIIIIIYFLN